MQDSQKNRYYRDHNGKMHVEGEYKEFRRPVSVENVEFYFNQARELIKLPGTSLKIRAVKYWKEILLLPDQGFAENWKSKSAKLLTFYKKAWGDSFLKLEQSINYLRTEDLEKKEFFLSIPKGFISMNYPSSWDHIEVRKQVEKLTTIYGILIGRKKSPLRLQEMRPLRGVRPQIQMVIAFDRFHHLSHININQYRKLWQRRLSYKKYARKAIKPVHIDSIANYYEYTKPAKIRKYLYGQKLIKEKNFAGEEHFSLKKNFGYYIAYLVEKKFYEKEKKNFQKLIKNIKIFP